MLLLPLPFKRGKMIYEAPLPLSRPLYTEIVDSEEPVDSELAQSLPPSLLKYLAVSLYSVGG